MKMRIHDVANVCHDKDFPDEWQGTAKGEKDEK